MKKPNITPGPWSFSPCPENAWNVSGHILAKGQTVETATAMCKGEANARLIAAAPQLAEALERLIAHVQEYRETGHMSGWDKGFKDAQTALLAAGYTE